MVPYVHFYSKCFHHYKIGVKCVCCLFCRPVEYNGRDTLEHLANMINDGESQYDIVQYNTIQYKNFILASQINQRAL